MPRDATLVSFWLRITDDRYNLAGLPYPHLHLTLWLGVADDPGDLGPERADMSLDFINGCMGFGHHHVWRQPAVKIHDQAEFCGADPHVVNLFDDATLFCRRHQHAPEREILIVRDFPAIQPVRRHRFDMCVDLSVFPEIVADGLLQLAGYIVSLFHAQARLDLDIQTY